METSTTYRWRPRVKVVVVDAAPLAVVAAIALASALVFIIRWPATPTRRAVAAMVREDAREMVALAEKHIPARIHIYGQGLSGGVLSGPLTHERGDLDVMVPRVDCSDRRNWRPAGDGCNSECGGMMTAVSCVTFTDAEMDRWGFGKVKEGVR